MILIDTSTTIIRLAGAMRAEILLSEKDFNDLLKILSVGGRWFAKIPEVGGTVLIREDLCAIDFCPEEYTSRTLHLNHINSFPEPEKISMGENVRIQFTNTQRRNILRSKGRRNYV